MKKKIITMILLFLLFTLSIYDGNNVFAKSSAEVILTNPVTIELDSGEVSRSGSKDIVLPAGGVITRMKGQYYFENGYENNSASVGFGTWTIASKNDDRSNTRRWIDFDYSMSNIPQSQRGAYTFNAYAFRNSVKFHVTEVRYRVYDWDTIKLEVTPEKYVKFTATRAESVTGMTLQVRNNNTGTSAVPTYDGRTATYTFNNLIVGNTYEFTFTSSFNRGASKTWTQSIVIPSDATEAKWAAEEARDAVVNMNTIMSPKLTLVEGAVRDSSGNTALSMSRAAKSSADLASQNASLQIEIDKKREFNQPNPLNLGFLSIFGR